MKKHNKASAKMRKLRKHKRIKTQKMWRMKGCSNTKKRGGNLPLAHTGKPIFSVLNPSLAYQGPSTTSMNLFPNAQSGGVRASMKGGCGSCGCGMVGGGKCKAMGGTRKSYYGMRGGGCGCGMLGGRGMGQQQQHRGGSCGCGMLGGRGRMRQQQQQGGSCGCGMRGRGCNCGMGMRGGVGSVAVGTVGSQWSPSIADWPGVKGSGSGNHLALNSYDIQPDTQGVINERSTYVVSGGGNKKMKGGLPFLSDFTNSIREVTHGIAGGYNALRGLPQPVSPSPYSQPYLSKVSSNY